MLTFDAKTKTFDAVYDTQSILRAVLEAMARPGTWRQLSTFDERCPVSRAGRISSIARTLIDNETTFAVSGSGAEVDSLAAHLTHTTSSPRVSG